jgi:hypothetical protein
MDKARLIKCALVSGAPSSHSIDRHAIFSDLPSLICGKSEGKLIRLVQERLVFFRVSGIRGKESPPLRASHRAPGSGREHENKFERLLDAGHRPCHVASPRLAWLPYTAPEHHPRRGVRWHGFCCFQAFGIRNKPTLAQVSRSRNRLMDEQQQYRHGDCV